MMSYMSTINNRQMLINEKYKCLRQEVWYCNMANIKLHTDSNVGKVINLPCSNNWNNLHIFS